MEDCANEMKDLTYEGRHLLAEVKYRARERGVIVQKPHLYENKNGRWQMTCNASAKNGGCIRMKVLTRAVTAGLERVLRPHRERRLFLRKIPVFMKHMQLCAGSRTAGAYPGIIIHFWKWITGSLP